MDDRNNNRDEIEPVKNEEFIPKHLRRLRWQLPPRGLGVFLVTILILGIFFRFANLNQKVYWFDEVLNTLYSSGYTKEEFVRQVRTWNNRELKAEDLQQYQQIKPGSTAWDVVQALAHEEPQNPPIYYLLSRGWMQLFGDSVTARRSLSAFMSLLSFPCIYWLCLELFDSSLAGWMAIALVSVSPFQILFAQEVRMYGTWAVTILLSSAALLRAIRIDKKLAWSLYATTLAISLYTFPFSALVAVGHGIYVAILEKFRFTKKAISYLVASLVGGLAFAPWSSFIILNSHKMGKWRQVQLSFPELLRKWITNFARNFIYIPDSLNLLTTLIVAVATLALISLVAYSGYFLFRRTPLKIWLFLFTLVGVIPVVLIAPDLLLGGQRSAIAKYLMPSYLGIQLAVAYLLAVQISQVKLAHQKRWKAMAVALLTAGSISCLASLPTTCDFNKKFSCDNLQIASIINRAKQPLVISNTSLLNAVHTLSLSYLLHPQVTFQFVIPPRLPEIPKQFNEVFIYSHDKSLGEGLERELDYQLGSKYRLESLYETVIVKLHQLTLTQ